MASLKLTIAYELDDGTKGEITADQRDFAAWELHADYGPIDERPFNYMRYCAWSALKRARQTNNKPYEWWKEHCVEAGDPRDETEVEAVEGDPTQTDQSAGA